MRALVTGASGFVGAATVPVLLDAGVDVRAFGRDEGRIRAAGIPHDVPVAIGDAVSGQGLDAALDGIDVAYYLIHSMEAGAKDYADDERRSAEAFALACARAGTRRVVYLGGPVPEGASSKHLTSRAAVEDILLAAAPQAVAFRASLIVGARSRSFRFLVRLVERAPVLPLPAWRDNRTQPIDGRDLVAYLRAAGTSGAVSGAMSLDAVGPDVLTYGEMVERIRDVMLLARPAIGLPFSLTPIASKFAAAIAGEDAALIEPLMESLEHETLPRDESVREVFPEVRVHRFDRAVEHALGKMEPLAAR